MSSDPGVDLLDPLFGDVEVRAQLSDRVRLQAMLDVEAFVFDIDGTLPATLPQLPSMVLKAPNDHTLQLDMPRSEDLNGVFAALSSHGIRVRSMRPESNRLEELFVRITSENKRATAAGAA